MSDSFIDIGELAKRSGLAASALRFYDACGLIEAELDDGLPRAYSPDVFKAKAGAVFQHVYDKYSRVA